MSNAKLLENVYFNWLKNEFNFSDLENGYVSISTPFIDSSYDNINIFASLTSTGVELSDFGMTLFNLDSSGISVTPKQRTRWDIFNGVLRDFGIIESDGILKITTSMDRFPIAKTRLLQAIMRINDIEYLSQSNIKTSFNELVQNSLTEKNILFTPSIEIATTNGVPSHFDFSIPNRMDRERLVKTVSRPNDINQAKIFNYDVHATKPVRNAKFIYLLNDQNNETNKIKRGVATAAMNDLVETDAEILNFSGIPSDDRLLVNS
ncbi:DUF1828 domain-containing protein [Leuconostoc pseudomesenteroides]|uniref:DUF1828 domain-containing protein n=1 Tax=Leuconostoc pseudomesenteroides TaxID=33968 RepID=UPI0021AA309C|nr:DUF1828 domain-containing protein [Leuconostoc pseudomesenteroides]MCT4388148.1 DUF1828 domain-containing protein [Leuconostoc pseudomesenteroides]